MKNRNRQKHHAPTPRPNAQTPPDADAPHEREAARDVAPTPGESSRGAGAVSHGVLFRRGVALDLTVVVCQLFLLAPLARALREDGGSFLAPGGDSVAGVVSPGVGRLFLSAFAAHAAGAYLKRLPRQARLAATGARRAPLLFRAGSPARKILVGVTCALLVGHFFIFMTLLFSGWQSTPLESWSPLFGKAGVANTYSAFFVRFVLIVFVMPLPTALVAVSLSVEPGASPPASWRTHPATEFVADLLLYFSIVVVTLVMNVIVAPRFASDAGVGELSSGELLASLVPMALAFSIIYLPPRLIYLAEDYRGPLAWLTILLALLSLAYRTFVPASFSW